MVLDRVLDIWETIGRKCAYALGAGDENVL